MRSTCRAICCPLPKPTKPAWPNDRQGALPPTRLNEGRPAVFKTVLHANDGSEPAFRALTLAIDIAKQNAAALHLVCVEEIPPMPEYLEEIREAKGTAARRFHTVIERARHLARARDLDPRVHILDGHP